MNRTLATRWFLIACLMAGAVALPACNTVEGVGRDISQAASATREYISQDPQP